MIGDEWHGSCIRSDVRVSPPHPRLDCVTAVSSDHPWPGGSDAGWTAPEGVRRRPVVRPRHAKRHAPAASPSRGAGGGREAVAAGRRSWRGLGLERNATPKRDGRDGGDARGHAPGGADASTITVTQATCPLCCPLGSFPVIAILALLCCAHALSWHIRHQKPRRKLQASSQS
jgi:hypothetical protein